MYIIIGREESKFCEASINYLKNKNLEYNFYDIENYDKTDKLWLSKPKHHLSVPIIYYDNEYIGGFFELIKHNI